MSNPSDPFAADVPAIEPVEPNPDQARNGWTTETLTRYVAERLQAGARRIAQGASPARNPGPVAQTDYDIQGF